MSSGLPPKPCSILQNFLHTTQQHAENSLFDVFMSVDGWGKGFCQEFKGIVARVFTESFDPCNIPCREQWSNLLAEDNDIAGQEDGAERARRVARALGGETAIGTNHLDPVSRLGGMGVECEWGRGERICGVKCVCVNMSGFKEGEGRLHGREE